MSSTRATPSLKTNHYSTQPSASVKNVIYTTRFARGVNRVTSHLFVIGYVTLLFKVFYTNNVSAKIRSYDILDLFLIQ
jgi:hypothetical protein